MSISDRSEDRVSAFVVGGTMVITTADELHEAQVGETWIRGKCVKLDNFQ